MSSMERFMPSPEFQENPVTERTQAIRQELAEHTTAARQRTVALALVIALTVAIGVSIVMILV